LRRLSRSARPDSGRAAASAAGTLVWNALAMSMGGRVALASVLVALAAMLASASGAAAAPVTLTWSGLGGQWSEKANWAGGEAPGEAVEPVDLDFPLSACNPAPFGCPATTDDLAELTVGTVTLESRVVAFTPKEPSQPGEPVHLEPGPASYFLKGQQPLTLMDGIVVHNIEEGTGQGLAGNGGTTLDMPLELGAANSWSVGPAPGGLDLWGTVTGHYPLTVALAGGGLDFAADTDVGPITISGHSGVSFGGPEANGDLNGSDGERVVLKGGSLQGGGRVGPLTLEGAGVEPGFPGSGGKLEVNGNLSLDSASNFVIEDNPNGKTREVTATGDAQLGSARLTLFEACVEPGATITLLQAQGGVSGQFTDPEGAPIENGEVLEDLTPSGCGAERGEPAPALRIEYGPETVTATALGEPQGAGEEPQGGSLEGLPALDGAQQGIAAYTSSSPMLTVTGPVKVRSRKLLVPLHCTSSEGACASVGLRLSVLEHLRSGHLTGVSAVSRSHRTTRVVGLGDAHVSLPAGQSRTVEIPLNSAAASITAHRTVHALLRVTFAGRTVRSETVAIPATARRGR
jgi:hypothetical protein